MGAEEVLEAHLQDCQSTMEALFLSGFTVAHDALLDHIERRAMTSRQMGLSDLADKLIELKAGMESLRHRLERDRGQEQQLIEIYCHINRYISLGIRKCRYDRVREALREALQEEM